MKEVFIRYTFVGVWGGTPPQMFIVTDRPFLRALFSDPYNTTEGLNPQGFFSVTRELNFQQTHNLLLSQQRIQVIAPDKDELSKILINVTEKIIQLNSVSEKYNLSFKSYSLSVEIELTDFFKKDENASLWLSEKFINKSIQLNEEFLTVNTNTIHFDVTNKVGIKYTITLQPRIANPKSLYIKITEEHASSVMNGDSLKNLEKDFDKMTLYVQEKIYKLLAI